MAADRVRAGLGRVPLLRLPLCASGFRGRADLIETSQIWDVAVRNLLARFTVNPSRLAVHGRRIDKIMTFPARGVPEMVSGLKRHIYSRGSRE